MKKTSRHLRVVPKVTVPVRASLRVDLDAWIQDIQTSVRGAVADLSLCIHDAKIDVVIDQDDLEPIRDRLSAALSELKCLGWLAEEVPLAPESAE